MRLLVDRQAAAAAGRRRKQLPSLRLIICLVLITINRVRSTCCCSDHREAECGASEKPEKVPVSRKEIIKDDPHYQDMIIIIF